MITSAGAENLEQALLKDGRSNSATIGPHDTLRTAAEKMAKSKLTSFPVIDAAGMLVGMINIDDLLVARSKSSLRDSDSKRVLTLRWPFGRQSQAAPSINRVVEPIDNANREKEVMEQIEERIERGLD
jgi:CBS domain-containing protein